MFSHCKEFMAKVFFISQQLLKTSVYRTKSIVKQEDMMRKFFRVMQKDMALFITSSKIPSIMSGVYF